MAPVDDNEQYDVMYIYIYIHMLLHHFRMTIVIIRLFVPILCTNLWSKWTTSPYHIICNNHFEQLSTWDAHHQPMNQWPARRHPPRPLRSHRPPRQRRGVSRRRPLPGLIQPWRPSWQLKLTVCYGKYCVLKGKSTISMGMFNSYFDIIREYLWMLMVDMSIYIYIYSSCSEQNLLIKLEGRQWEMRYVRIYIVGQHIPL